MNNYLTEHFDRLAGLASQSQQLAARITEERERTADRLQPAGFGRFPAHALEMIERHQNNPTVREFMRRPAHVLRAMEEAGRIHGLIFEDDAEEEETDGEKSEGTS